MTFPYHSQKHLAKKDQGFKKHCLLHIGISHPAIQTAQSQSAPDLAAGGIEQILKQWKHISQQGSLLHPLLDYPPPEMKWCSHCLSCPLHKGPEQNHSFLLQPKQITHPTIPDLWLPSSARLAVTATSAVKPFTVFWVPNVKAGECQTADRAG